MTLSVQQISIAPFIDLLTNMQAWLDKAVGLKPEAELMEARLAPDMYPLAKQYQIVSDAAKGAAARLTGTEAPTMTDTEANFAELQNRCARTIAYLRSVDADALEAGLDREIVITFPNGSGIRFDGRTFLTGFALPNFYFHAAIAYAILRNQGLEMGKGDFLTHLMPYMFAPPEAADA